MLDKVREFVIALGPLYLRVLIGSIVLMMVGLLMFSIGYYVLGNGIMLIPGRQYSYSSYISSIEYVVSDVKTFSLTLTTVPEIVGEFELRTPGYLSIDISSIEPDIAVQFDITDSSHNLIYSVIVRNGEHVSLPIYSPGTYRVTARLASTQYLYMSNVNVKIEVFSMREASSIIIARWFQLIGLTLIGIGFLILLFSYRIAVKTAEAEYYIPPKELREEIASESYIKIFTPRILGEEEEEEE